MNFNEAKELKAKLQCDVDTASAGFEQFPKSANGLISDEVRNTAAYKLVSAEYNEAFSALRVFNSSFVKVFRKELAAERKARFK